MMVGPEDMTRSRQTRPSQCKGYSSRVVSIISEEYHKLGCQSVRQVNGGTSSLVEWLAKQAGLLRKAV